MLSLFKDVLYKADNATIMYNVFWWSFAVFHILMLYTICYNIIKQVILDSIEFYKHYEDFIGEN